MYNVAEDRLVWKGGSLPQPETGGLLVVWYEVDSSGEPPDVSTYEPSADLTVWQHVFDEDYILDPRDNDFNVKAWAWLRRSS